MGQAKARPLHAMWLKSELLEEKSLGLHPQSEVLVAVAVGGSNLSSAGYPFIVEDSFYNFISSVPHLFEDGERILQWVDDLDAILASRNDVDEDALASLKRTRKVLRNMVYTAAITAPSDLWLLRQVLGAHAQRGLLQPLLEGKCFRPEDFASEFGLDLEQLLRDWHFLVSRAYLTVKDGSYGISSNPASAAVLANAKPIPKAWRVSVIAAFVGFLRDDECQRSRFLEKFLAFEAEAAPTGSWVANYREIEIGYRLLPLVLGLRAANLHVGLVLGADASQVVPKLLPCMIQLLQAAGTVDQSGKVTRLGARVFERGSGPFGIIGAYDAYLNRLDELLLGNKVDSWVSRGENVAASQDANRKTFKDGNDTLDRFCADYRFEYAAYIEHAVGKGEATRQRFQRNGEESILYFGADLEDAAIDEAVKQQALGELPGNMRFIRGADIGVPEKVTGQLEAWGVPTHGAVMIVGNGFHEIRNQTNDKMKAVFEGYQKAGFFLIFTEESALSDKDLLNTAWNTYHAGFRYVHEISGQGLRPAEVEENEGRWSWSHCAQEAGYLVHPDYSCRTRTIFPFRKGAHNNPSISMTYFCIPTDFVDELGVVAQ